MIASPVTEDGARLRTLVQPARVHRSLYTDPRIFDLEMERIFGRAWIYVGHESQIPQPGDYLTTRIGRVPLVLTRHSDGTVRLLHNQCAHRGAQVVATESGHATEFRCCYHGWTYGTDGRLKSAPLLKNYPGDFDPKDPRLAMIRVPRVTSYRGFVFGSLAADGPTLTDFLGYMTSSFDDMVDRAPGGEITVDGGSFRHAYNANWKLYLENLCDAAHPLFVHQSSIEAAKLQPDMQDPDSASEIGIRQMRQNGASYAFWESQVGIWSYPNGHSFLGDYHDDEKLVAALADPTFDAYIKALAASQGAARAQEIIAVRRWNSNVYPNLSFMSQFQQLRVVHPIAVDRTIVHTYNFRLKGAPNEMFERTIALANVANGNGSLVLTDDLETYGRIGLGLRSAGAEWLQIGRGFTTDRRDDHGGLRGENSTSEIYIRNMFAAWLGYMTAGPEHA
jgi:phenylpropionate dioxygenase-like ring-hydroxylating dioxygenase large terminal subunit